MTVAQTTFLEWAAQAPPMELTVAAPSRGWAYTAHRIYLVAKRIVDVTLATFLLIAAAPILAVAAIAIKLTSRGPILFRQARAGLHGKPFTMYKLRTMYQGAAEDRNLFKALNELEGAPVFKIRRDPRITRVGRWLRRSSIDELPQLFNVLRGEMSLVGPRPLPLDEIRTENWGEWLRLSVRPGLTCLWQIAGRTEIPYGEWMQLDGYYVQNRSLALDLRIILKTIPAVLSGRGAY